MTSYELVQKIDAFVESLSRCLTLNDLLVRMTAVNEDVNKVLAESLGSGGKAEGKLNRFILIQALPFRHTPIRIVFREVDILQRAFRELEADAFVGKTNDFLDILNTLEEFATAYEQLIQDAGTASSIRAFQLATILTTNLRSVNGVLVGVRRRLIQEPEISEDRDSLSLLLQPSDEVRVIVAKVRSLEFVYEEICRLLNISTSEYPLEISKIEVGSPLWTKLFGESKVIKLVTDLIRDAIEYRYRNFTREGQLGSIPRKADELGSLLNLEGRMANLGYDTTNMRESIQKSGAVIAKELNTLLAGETEVVVNGELFSLTSVVDQLIAERRNTLLLEEGANGFEELNLGDDATEQHLGDATSAGDASVDEPSSADDTTSTGDANNDPATE